MTSCSGKEKEEYDMARVLCLLYNLKSNSRDSDDLSIGFHRSFEDRERQLSNIKNTKGNYHVIFYPKDVFGFAGHQDNCTYALGCKLPLQK